MSNYLPQTWYYQGLIPFPALLEQTHPLDGGQFYGRAYLYIYIGVWKQGRYYVVLKGWLQLQEKQYICIGVTYCVYMCKGLGAKSLHTSTQSHNLSC